MTDRRVLFCCRATPEYYRRPLFSGREVFCGPDCADVIEDGRVVSLRTPAGEYDIMAVIARLPAEQRPDLVVVKADATRGNFPRQFDRLACPKVLLVGDTHHFPAPLRHMLRYAGMESFDSIVFDHTRQHAHFFQDAGFERVFWIPAFDYALRRRPVPAAPELPVSFIGQTGGFHPYRRHALETVQRAGLPLQIFRAPPEQTADLQAASAITLNCSLNGDLNLRVFEALGAGAFLLTDRLAPEAGLDRLFEAGRHLDVYGDPDELVDKIRHYLDHPDEALRIRAAGQAHLLAAHAPEIKQRQFFDLLDHDRVDPALDLADDRRSGPARPGRQTLDRRVAAYEAVQQTHLRCSRLTVFSDADDGLGLTAAARDLPRTRCLRHDVVMAGVSRPSPPQSEICDEEILALAWPESADAAPALLARFRGRLVLALGRSWRDNAAAAAFLAHWGFAPTDEEGLFRCADPFAAAEAAIGHAPAPALAPRVADLSDFARNAAQAWRAARLADALNDPLLYERLLLRCVSLDRGHIDALQALAVQAAAAGRWSDAAIHAGELARRGAAVPPACAAALTWTDPRVQACRNIIAGRPAVAGGGWRILVATNLFPPQEFGGYGRKLWEFTAELRRRGHQIKVLAANMPAFYRPGVAGSEDLEPLVERSLQLYGIWRNGAAYIDEDPERRAAVAAANDQRILAAAEAFGAEICLAGNVDLMTAGFLSALPARGVPVIHCVGNQHPGYKPDQTPASPLYRLGPASNWVADKLGRDGFTGPARTVLYPGARVDSFYRPLAPACDRLRIAFASLLTPYKGPQVLTNALAILQHNGIDFECEFAGDAPDAAFATALRDFCARFGDRVRFTGFQDRRGMAALFDRSNVLVFPSIFEEPFGISQVEAMAAGLLVISSGSGGSGEIIRHEQDGLIAAPDNAEALAYALAGLPADPQRWTRLARQGQARSLSFTVARTVDRIEATGAELFLAENARR